jgi:hypothetical protein
MVDAWLIAHVVTYLVGALGVAMLSIVVLRATWSRVAFVALTCLSYPMLVQTVHVQSFAFLSVSWLFVGLAAVHRGASSRTVEVGLVLLAVVPPTLALTSYYSLVLALMLLGSLGLFAALFTDRGELETVVRRDLGRLWAALRTPTGAVAALVGVLLWAFAAWIYLPARGLLPTPVWSSVTTYSPRWSDLFNASGGGGGIWGRLYDGAFSGPPISFERTLGFTPLLFVSFPIVGLLTVRSAVVRSEPEALDGGFPARRGLMAAWFALLAVVFALLVDEQGVGVFKLLWDYVPGVEAIRSPFRVQLLLYPLATFVVLRGIESVIERPSRPTKTPKGSAARMRTTALASLLALALLVEMYRPAEFHWAPAQLLDSSLRAQAQEVAERCDALIVADLPSGRDTRARSVQDSPPILRSIDAVVLSALTGVPTAQGYGRGAPIGHPGNESDSEALVRWMRREGFGGSVCTVSSDGIDVER